MLKLGKNRRILLSKGVRSLSIQASEICTKLLWMLRILNFTSQSIIIKTNSRNCRRPSKEEHRCKKGTANISIILHPDILVLKAC